jgi:hypothetical protein
MSDLNDAGSGGYSIADEEDMLNNKDSEEREKGGSRQGGKTRKTS